MIYADKCRLIAAERKYNPQGGSIFVCVITLGSLLSSATQGYRRYNRDAVVFHPIAGTPKRMGWLGGGVASVSNRMEWSDAALVNISKWMEYLERGVASIFNRMVMLGVALAEWFHPEKRLGNALARDNHLSLSRKMPSLAITNSRYRENYPRSR